ncbi:18593_t:CDS:1 [Dentiscutata erythropus]|uniref:18593_t:CDS:1 n=1 Tax=Dentiscutata erythropus TaxID=1348616 RepID=A0A9N9HGH6_9GLOM|nr:18593_t:CDS:1 [Dentiscutata erythropus]
MDIQMPSISEIEEFDIEKLTGNNDKSLNPFFLYRREYTKRAIKNGMKIKMTDISKMAAKSWKNEDTMVKEAYAKVSRRIDDLLRKRRQEKRTYQIVYDVNMERFLQESEHVSNQLELVPLQSFPPNEYVSSLNVDDVAFHNPFGINANMESIPQEPDSVANQLALVSHQPFPPDEYICSLNLDDIIFLDSLGINVFQVAAESIFCF